MKKRMCARGGGGEKTKEAKDDLYREENSEEGLNTSTRGSKRQASKRGKGGEDTRYLSCRPASYRKGHHVRVLLQK